MCNFKDTIGLSNNIIIFSKNYSMSMQTNLVEIDDVIVNKDIIGIWELKCEEN